MELQSIEQLNWAYGLLVMSPEPLWKMWRIASMLVGLALHESLIENEREFYFGNNPIGSMVLVYIYKHWGYIDGIHVTIYGSTMDPMGNVQSTLLGGPWNLMTLSSFVPQNCCFAGASLGPKMGWWYLDSWSGDLFQSMYSTFQKYPGEPHMTTKHYRTLQDIA